MGIPALARRHLYIETPSPPRTPYINLYNHKHYTWNQIWYKIKKNVCIKSNEFRTNRCERKYNGEIKIKPLFT